MCGFEGSADNLAAMARWTHPYPCRTRKLSIAAATIVGNGKNSTLPVCPVPKGTPFFLPFFPEAYFTVIVKEKIPFTSLVNKKYYSHNL